MSDSPVTDLIERLLSLGLSTADACAQGRAIEAAYTKSSGSTPEQRERWRLQKDAQRKKSSNVHRGQKSVHILTVVTKTPCVEVRKKESKKEPELFVHMDKLTDSRFDEFWKRYPPGRKESKKAVRAKLEKILKRGEASFEQIMAGIDRYIASGVEPKFTKAPLVWLNKGCWDAEYVSGHPNGKMPNGAGSGPRGRLSFGDIARQGIKDLEAVR